MNFLIQFFNSLKNNNIRYCVLRNYQQLPASTDGSDLDILISKHDSAKFMALIKSISKDNNGYLVSYISSDICPRICILGDKEQCWGIMIDLHYDEITYRNYTILSNKIIWENTIIFNGISVLNPEADSLIGLFKELLNNEKCSSIYFDKFQKLALDEKFITSVFNDIKKPHLVTFLLELRYAEYSDNLIKKIVTKLNTEFPKSKFSLIYKVRKLSRLKTQPGYTIAFLGTDGSGKSTIIERITPIINEAFHNAVFYEHMRPNKIPSIASLLGKKVDFDGPTSNPHGGKPSGFIGSLVRWLYYMLDYTFGYCIKVLPKKSIRSCVWIFDRYYYDYLIDPKRSRVKLPTWIIKFGQIIIPEPDIIICLGTHAEIIHKRKPELPLEEVKKQVDALKLFCQNNKRAIWIDTGVSIDDSSNEALNVIIEMMSKRFENVKLN